METQPTYQSFNRHKSYKELQYTLSTNALRLYDLKLELQFYMALLYKPIFKPRIANLYEVLARYKYNLVILEERCLKLQHNVNEFIGETNSKIQGQSALFDEDLNNNYDALESEIFNFYRNVSNFKQEFFEYIQSASLN